MFCRIRTLVASLALAATAAPASAQPKTTLPPPKDGRLANLVPVPVPDSAAVALSEPLGLLAFCHERNREGPAEVSLVRLDAKGNPAAYSTSWKLPRPDALAKTKVPTPTYALNAAFHPKLPLLYVWQDAGLNYVNAPVVPPPEVKDFDHLLIYSVAKDQPELVAALCRGQEYMYGQNGGGLAVDPSGEFLYVPNLRDLKNPGFMRFGRFALDADGLPRLDEKDAKLPVAARLKRLAELNAAKGTTPTQITPIEYVTLFPNTYAGAGHSFHVVSKEAVIAGGGNGVLTWRPDDKDCALQGLSFKPANHVLITAHAKLPLLFATPYQTDCVHRVEHADGYLTLLPHQFVLPETQLTSPPAVLTKSNKLAVGGHYHVYVIDLDEKGRPRPEVLRVRVLNPRVRALVYSDRFDRLYVGVEVSK